MNSHFLACIKQATGAAKVEERETIQNLWSGYGKIIRLELEGGTTKSVVVKHVKFPQHQNHPRGWNTNTSHQRKLRSYEVEVAWYQNWASMCNDRCRIPRCLALETMGNEVLMVLEDLDASGFNARQTTLDWKGIVRCLQWLAHFHARFMGMPPSGLWETGTYWHLATRPDELAAMDDLPLKKAAAKIDQQLSSSPYQTLVHGDAKLANFCFSADGSQVAAVDFQYVGGGCGMKDVAYFIGSCLDEEACEQREAEILDSYFEALARALAHRNGTINVLELEKNWRELYPVAWTDFHRFLKGWSPDHWKLNSYSERIAQQVIADLEKME